MNNITLVAHDIRSTHNVGAFFRTCDGLGVQKIIFSGYTPYPSLEDDTRLPHFADKLTRQIHKTALGAECTVDFERFNNLEEVIEKAKQENAVLIALEQYPGSLSPEACVQKIKSQYEGRPIYLIIGNEVHGVADDLLAKVDIVMEIPMKGIKESLNVSVATAIALYELSK
jgi:23S rRNA (guanosine2251-2'-O)-methyltransferase